MANVTSDIRHDEFESLIKDPKATADLSEMTNDAIASAEVMVKNGQLESAITALIIVEKKARQASDASSLTRIVSCILRLNREADDWIGINTYASVLVKKRSQLKRVVTDIVKQCMSWIEETPTKEIKLELIENLSGITEGKFCVEIERGRLLAILAKIKEEDGDVAGAADVLQDVPIETFGAMDRKEKTDYILNQMRIVLKNQDFIRCQIISKKINPKLLLADDYQDCKLLFYDYMVQYHLHDKDHSEAAKAYFACFDTPKVLKDSKLWKSYLKLYIAYLIISPISSDRTNQIHKLSKTESKKLGCIPSYKRLLYQFLTKDLVTWPLAYEKDIKMNPAFRDITFGEQRWKLFRTSVLQHSIMTLSSNYDCIRVSRMAELLSITEEEAEGIVCDLVINKDMQCCIDRPAGLITFGAVKNTNEILNEWSSDIAKVLSLVEETSYLVDKERMVQDAAQRRLKSCK